MTVNSMLANPMMRDGSVPDFKTVDRPSSMSRKKRIRYADPRQDNILPWISLNPSGKVDDGRGQTGRRIFEFAWRWGFDGVAVYNLYPFHSPKPQSLANFIEGNEHAIAENLDFVRNELLRADAVLVAWGNPPRNIREHSVVLAKRLIEAVNSSRDADEAVALWCLGTTQKGFPRHPSPLGRVPLDTKPMRWIMP